MFCSYFVLILIWVDVVRKRLVSSVATHMVGVDMVGEWHGETHHNVLSCMYIRHDTNLGAFKHRMVEEAVNHRQCILVYIVCKYLAVLAVFTFQF